jgi:tetratricopeptide (TPR) repeat protein
VALDGVAQYYLRQGLYGRMGSVLERRLSFVPSIQDPWELGDVFATAAWAEFCTGRYRRAVSLAAEGFERARQGAVAPALHCLDWLALARCRLGDWPGFFAEAGRIAELLGDRSEQPPGFASDHFGAAALVHEIQGDSGSADRLLQVLRWLEQTEERPSPVWMAWVSLVFARRGAFADARALLRRIEEIAPGPGRGPRLEAWCDVVCEEEAWDELREVVTESRRHADEAALLALPYYADRAEGRAALAAGDARSAIELLSTSAAGFSELGAEWESARARLYLSESLALAGEPAAARRRLSETIPVFDRLRSIAETARAAGLLSRLA